MRLLLRKDNVVVVKGLDVVDGSPIIDIKPYHPQYDLASGVKIPSWVNKLVF